MKRKDDLLRLAFGELADDVARAVEAKADDAKRAEVETFRRLHDDLRHLPSPPPDNLSAERLRAAILDRELKAKRSFSWGPALFAPAALAALAVVVLLPRLRTHAEPQIVSLNESKAEQHRGLDFGLQNSFGDASAAAPLRARDAFKAPAPRVQAQSASAEPHREREPSVAGHRRRYRRPVEPIEEPQLETDGMIAKVFQSEADSSPSLALNAPKLETIPAPPSAVVEAAPGSGGKTETVVIVSTKRDLETGAPAAMETEASSVLVGG